MVYSCVGIRNIDGYAAALLCEHLQNCKTHSMWTQLQPNSQQLGFWQYCDGRSLDHVDDFVDFDDFLEMAKILWAMKYNNCELSIINSTNKAGGLKSTKIGAEYWLSGSVCYKFVMDVQTYVDSETQAHMFTNLELISSYYLESRNSDGDMNFCDLTEAPPIIRLVEQLAGKPNQIVDGLNNAVVYSLNVHQEHIIQIIETHCAT